MDVTVSIGASAAPSVLTIAPDPTFRSPFDIAADLQAQLNNNVQGHPQAAAAMQAAVGYGGAWTSGAAYLCNESSGNAVSVFGSPATLTASGSITYGEAGYRGGIDKAIQFASGNNSFTGGAVFDVTGSLDLVLFGVVKWESSATASTTLLSKVSASFNDGWALQASSTTEMAFTARQGGGGTFRSSSVAMTVGTTYAVLAIIDRSANVLRIGVQDLATGTQTLGSVATPGSENFTTAANFTFGSSAWTVSAMHNVETSYFAVNVGSGVATGVGANFSSALTRLANAINDSWTVALSPTTGRITVGGSFWPRSVEFPSALRDLLGFDRDFNYPTTAEQMAAVGGGKWTSGASYLCNESAGNLSSVFGSPATLTAAGSPTYSNQGARGGTDKAVGFDSTGDQFSGGDLHDVGASHDLAVALVCRVTNPSAGLMMLVDKHTTGPTRGYFIYTFTDGKVYINIGDGTTEPFAGVTVPTSEPFVLMAVVDRSTAKLRIGVSGLTSGTTTVSTETSISGVGDLGNSANLLLGSPSISATQSWHCSAFSITAGAGVATGLSAGLSSALSAFAASLKAQTGTLQSIPESDGTYARMMAALLPPGKAWRV